MKKKIRWANIICNKSMQPNMLIVSDGEWDTQIPISNSPRFDIAAVKKVARDIYGVPARRVIVTQILGDVNDKSKG